MNNVFANLLIQIDSVVDRDEGLGRFLGQVHPVGSDLRSGELLVLCVS